MIRIRRLEIRNFFLTVERGKECRVRKNPAKENSQIIPRFPSKEFIYCSGFTYFLTKHVEPFFRNWVRIHCPDNRDHKTIKTYTSDTRDHKTKDLHMVIKNLPRCHLPINNIGCLRITSLILAVTVHICEPSNRNIIRCLAGKNAIIISFLKKGGLGSHVRP